MIVEVKLTFVSKSGYPFRRRYVYNAMKNPSGGYFLQYKYKKSVSHIRVTEEEFNKYFSLIDDKDLAEVYIA